MSDAPQWSIAMILFCPWCRGRHIDEGEFASKPHHTHACQHCGVCWRPAVVNTVGVQFLPGFKNEPRSTVASVASQVVQVLDNLESLVGSFNNGLPPKPNSNEELVLGRIAHLRKVVVHV